MGKHSGWDNYRSRMTPILAEDNERYVLTSFTKQFSLSSSHDIFAVAHPNGFFILPSYCFTPHATLQRPILNPQFTSSLSSTPTITNPT